MFAALFCVCVLCVCTCEDYLGFMMAIREKMELFEVSFCWKSAKETHYLVCQRTPLSELERGHFIALFTEHCKNHQ